MSQKYPSYIVLKISNYQNLLDRSCRAELNRMTFLNQKLLVGGN